MELMAEAHHGYFDTSMEMIGGGATVEAIGGGAAVVLAILGLAGVLPAYMAPIATLAIGAALCVEGGALVARCSRLISRAGGTRSAAAELGGGTSAELLGGGAGVVLGILALLGVAPTILVAAAVVTFGGSLLFGSAATARLNAVTETSSETHAQHLAREAVWVAVGAQVLTGFAAVVLGVIALVGLAPMVVSLVALLAVGAAVLLSGSAVGGRTFSTLFSG
jgi:hypothetical protein